MTVKLNLDPEIESRIVAQAAERGVPVEVYLRDLIERGASVNLPDAAAHAAFSKWNDDDDSATEHKRLALAGEAIAAHSLLPEDFSDWE